MQVTNRVQTGLTAEIKIVPKWAWTLAVIALASAQVFMVVIFRDADAPAVWIRVLLGSAAGAMLGCYFVLLGYVNRDARRRGMSPLLWTVVAVVITNGLGIILYFILRQPLQRTCPQCGSTVQTGFNFCPRCSSRLSPSCKQCQRMVGMSDTYCPYCASVLQVEAVSAQ